MTVAPARHRLWSVGRRAARRAARHRASPTRSTSPTCPPTCTTGRSGSCRSCEPLLDAAAAQSRPVFVAYADCGTGGALDALLDRHPGRHAFPVRTATSSSAAPSSSRRCTKRSSARFYLTDFLAKHFDALVWQGLGLDRHPQLRDMYFGNYTPVVLISQTDNDGDRRDGPASPPSARAAFEHRHVGMRAVHHRDRSGGVSVSLSRRVA